MAVNLHSTIRCIGCGMTFYIEDAIFRGRRPTSHSSNFICNECLGDGVRIPLAAVKAATDKYTERKNHALATE